MRKPRMRGTSLALALALTLSLLAGCGTAATQSAAPAAAEAAAESEPIAIPTVNGIVLDYAEGIAQGIYGWTLSEDGSYYMLSALNEDGTIKESEARQNFMGGGGQGGQGGMRGGMNGEAGSLPDGAALPEGEAGTFARKDMPGEGQINQTGDALATEDNQQATLASVSAQGVYTESSITNTEYQTMLVFVPAAYMTVDEAGNAVFTEAEIGGYTAETAPIVFQNSNGGWRSGAPKEPEYADTLAAGMIYVSCGSRSRDALAEDGTNTGKAPTPVADLKAGVIALRANAAVLPGDTEKIISVGSSGGGQMSSALGATGNMEAYYPYLYEAGAIGVSFDAATGTYASEYDDSVYAAMAYCPIADIENADLAYAWLRYDSTLNADGSMSATTGSYNFSAFQLALQEDAATAFAAYINSLGLVDADGNALTFDENADGTLNPRSGSYYDVTLQNISDALNATLAAEADAAGYLAEKYGTDTSWLTQNADDSYQVTDLAAFIEATGLVRNKDIPGFDALNLSAENDAFGAADTQAVHYSASIAQLLQDNYDAYSALDGFDAEQVDLYIQNALTGEEAAAIAAQIYLVNATAIMLNVANGTEQADIAQVWRTRNGTADQHTSFSVAYNITLAAGMAGAEADYALVWAMGHGSNEGTTTGTFVDWINEIC